MTNGPAPNGMLPNLHAIVAVCDDWGIGLAGGMVVDNREDMRHFVACTKGHTVLMGRRTLESFPGGRPLRNRRNIVVTTDPAFSREGVEVAHAIEEALALIGHEETWLIGGGMLYRARRPLRHGRGHEEPLHEARGHVLPQPGRGPIVVPRARPHRQRERRPPRHARGSRL